MLGQGIQMTADERRKMPRFDLQLPVEIEHDGSVGPIGLTRDVSAGGVYFFVTNEVNSGEMIQFVMTFPPEITLVKSLRVRCTSRILRVDRDTPRGTGVAAQIQRYEFISTAEA